MAPGYAELALHWHDGLCELVPLGEYAARHQEWQRRNDEAERESRCRHNSAALQWMLSEFDNQPMEVDDGDGHTPKVAAPWDENACYVPYLAVAIETCLTKWGTDEEKRRAATRALEVRKGNRAAELRTQHGVGKSKDEMDALIAADAEVKRLSRLLKCLRRLADRHRVVRDLDASLPAANGDGIRLGREEYAYKAFHGHIGVGRRYAKGERWEGADGKPRWSNSQGMPNDVRAYLLGHKMTEQDGRASDPTLDIIMAYKLGIPKQCVQALIDYLTTDEARNEWHEEVAAHHGTTTKIVKRWPNVLSNSGVYATCLREAGLPANAIRHERVTVLETAMRRLRFLIADALRGRPNALWPGSERFWDDEMERIGREYPSLDERERMNKAFSFLRQTVEDKICTINMKAQRQAYRQTMGKDAHGQWLFDLLPPEQRDTGGYQFDGLMTEVRADCDRSAGNQIANEKLIEEGWHASMWGITYQIVEKKMAADADPDDFDSAKGAREALQEAINTYPEVRGDDREDNHCGGEPSRKRRRGETEGDSDTDSIFGCF